MLRKICRFFLNHFSLQSELTNSEHCYIQKNYNLIWVLYFYSVHYFMLTLTKLFLLVTKSYEFLYSNWVTNIQDGIGTKDLFIDTSNAHLSELNWKNRKNLIRQVKLIDYKITSISESASKNYIL